MSFTMLTTSVFCFHHLNEREAKNDAPPYIVTYVMSSHTTDALE